MFFENEHSKYVDPVTGCHFEYNDLCRRMLMMKKERDKLYNMKEEEEVIVKVREMSLGGTAESRDRSNKTRNGH
jgi:hypothetical protein